MCRETYQDFVIVFPVFLHVYSISVAVKVLWCGLTSILCCLENKLQNFRYPTLLPRTGDDAWCRKTGGLKEQ